MNNSYSDLQKVSFEHAITAMTELVLERGTRDKILAVPVRLSADNYNKGVSEGKEFTILIYRPTNYTFVGMIEKSFLRDLKDEDEVHFEAYHDSCWRDGISRVIKDIVKEISDKIDETVETKEDNIFSHSSFGISDPKLIDGNIRMDESDSSNRKAYFKVL